jgi:hypothetical protein
MSQYEHNNLPQYQSNYRFQVVINGAMPGIQVEWVADTLEAAFEAVQAHYGALAEVTFLCLAPYDPGRTPWYNIPGDLS